MTLLRRRAPLKRVVTKTITMFRPQIRSQHPSHNILRGILDRVNKRVVVRLGSTTTLRSIYEGKLTEEQMNTRVIEINKVEAIKNSANKLLMKQCFTRAEVKTAQWFIARTDGTFLCNNTEVFGTAHLPYPIVSKSLHGSRGVGNTKHDSQAQLEAWMRGKNLAGYVFEKFYTYSKEYRIHVTNDGCFYACRKLLKNTAPEGTWQRHDDGNVTWIVEENPKFMKPATWDLIVADCIKAKNALGLDICSFDVMTQGSTKERPEWIIIESQSAPSFGEITGKKYIIELNKLIRTRL